jgi:hypothetical protein
MPTSKSSNPGSGPDQRPAIAIDAELADRLVAALEQLGGAVASDRGKDERNLFGGTVDPVRARASRDYEVLRGMLGRADAPTPLRMRRERSYGQGEPAVEEQDASERNDGDNRIVVLDPVPLTAHEAIVESPGDGSTTPLSERVRIPAGESTPTLALTTIRGALPISRVEIVDVKDKLVAFGPSLGPLPEPKPHYQPSGGR